MERIIVGIMGVVFSFAFLLSVAPSCSSEGKYCETHYDCGEGRWDCVDNKCIRNTNAFCTNSHVYRGDKCPGGTTLCQKKIDENGKPYLCIIW